MNSDLDALVRLTKSDIESGANVLARAFQDDALESYFMPDTEVRRKLLPYFFQYRIHFGILYGEVYSTSPEMEGIAVWYPPGKSDMTPWRMMRAGGINLQRKVGTEIISKMSFVNKYVTDIRKQYAPFPHWHLFPMGVDPPSQGKGFASALLRPMFNRFDAEGMACYLETQNERNVSIYQHYGFKVVHTTALPDTDIMHWAMIRLQDN